MSNKKYLDEFGEKIVGRFFNYNLKSIKKLTQLSDNSQNDFSKFFKGLTNDQQIFILNFLQEEYNDFIFSLGTFFEENDQFKIMYDNGNELIDLKEVSHNEGNAGFLHGETLDWIDDYGINIEETNN